MTSKQRTSRQIAGYRAQVQGALNADRTGAEITIDITTARALVEICDQAMLALSCRKQRIEDNRTLGDRARKSAR